jgi:mannose-6-phosphate isomerase-like protein (cupin superfamily)
MSEQAKPGATLRKLSYKKPAYEGERAIVLLGGTDIERAAVQLIKAGARQGLHAHANYDGLYLVLEGRVRFWGIDGLFAEIGPKEAVLVPRGVAYGFAAAEGEAEMLHVSAVDLQAEPGFTAYEPGADAATYQFFDPSGAPVSLASRSGATSDEG